MILLWTRDSRSPHNKAHGDNSQNEPRSPQNDTRREERISPS